MKNDAPVTNNNTKSPVLPFITFLGFIAIGVNSLFKGIDQHEPWRIVASAVGCALFIGLSVALTIAVVKNKRASNG